MIYRAEHTQKFTVVDNGIIHDLRISVKARYLLMLILSLPDDWKFSISGLSAIMGEGVVSVRSGLNELAEAGYLKRTKNRGADGRFEYDYEIREIPIKADKTEQKVNENKIKSEVQEQKSDEPKTKELKTAISEYINMRRKMGKPLSKAGYNRLISRLRHWADTEQAQAEIVNKSIERSWVDIYKPDSSPAVQYRAFAPPLHTENEIHDIEQFFMKRQCSGFVNDESCHSL